MGRNARGEFAWCEVYQFGADHLGWSRGDADRAAPDRTPRLRSGQARRSARPHTSFSLHRLLWEFEGYELGWLCTGVGYGVGIVAGEPFAVAGFEVAGHGAHALYVAANF